MILIGRVWLYGNASDGRGPSADRGSAPRGCYILAEHARSADTDPVSLSRSGSVRRQDRSGLRPAEVHLFSIRRALRKTGGGPAGRRSRARGSCRVLELQQPPASGRLFRGTAGRRHRDASERAADPFGTGGDSAPRRAEGADLRDGFCAAGGATPAIVPRRRRNWSRSASPTKYCWREGASTGPTSSRSTKRAICELFYTVGIHRHAQRRHALASHALPARAWRAWRSSCRNDKAVELHTIPLFHANGWGRAHSST